MTAARRQPLSGFADLKEQPTSEWHAATSRVMKRDENQCRWLMKQFGSGGGGFMRAIAIWPCGLERAPISSHRLIAPFALCGDATGDVRGCVCECGTHQLGMPGVVRVYVLLVFLVVVFELVLALLTLVFL